MTSEVFDSNPSSCKLPQLQRLYFPTWKACVIYITEASLTLKLESRKKFV